MKRSIARTKWGLESPNGQESFASHDKEGVSFKVVHSLGDSCSVRIVLGILSTLVFAGYCLGARGSSPGRANIREQVKADSITPEQISELWRTRSAAQQAEQVVVPDANMVSDANIVQDQNEVVEIIKEEPSAIELLLSGEIGGVVSTRLTQFGYDVFREPVSTFAPVTDVPVGPDYVVGPGDTFTVTLWGRVNAQYTVTLNRNGEVVLPDVGVLSLSGMTVGRLQDYLRDQFSRKHTDFKMAITMGRLRTIRVYVVGEAQTPGSYTLSSLSTVINALFAAGGPSKNGSLRKVRLLRNRQESVTIDLYEFLLGGDKSDNRERRIIADFDISAKSDVSEKNETTGTIMQDGDVVKVFPVLALEQNVVYLEGHVERPGKYELKPGMRLRDIVKSYETLQAQPSLEYGEIERLVEPDLHPIVIPFNVRKLLEGDESENIELARFDRIWIFRWDERIMRNVSISGLIYRPGEYRLVADMKVKDLVDAAGGLMKNAYLKTAEITRRYVSQSGMRTEKMDIDLEKALAGAVEHNIPLRDYDHLIVRPIPELEFDRVATVSGEVMFPGTYPIRRGETLSSLIERAGGYTDRAYLRGAVFTRESAKAVQERRMDELVRQIEETILVDTDRAMGAALDTDTIQAQQMALQAKRELLSKIRAAKIDGRVVIRLAGLADFKGSKYDLELEKGDELAIPETPGFVSVVGEVFNPTSLLYEKDRTVSYYLNRVGGLTKEGDKKQLGVIRADGSVISIAQRNHGQVSWDSESNQWHFGGFMNVRLNPGDTIIVPRKMDRFFWLKTTKDITQILFNVALAAGVVLAL